MAEQSGVGASELRTWLTARVAEYLGRPPEEIDVTADLAVLGLDSVFALALCGDIEQHLDVVLQDTVVWDHPSVEALTSFLTELPALAGDGAAHGAGAP
ncbi:acyl carrier protein [Actinacidiphila yeochonensis]|uniref:acyl carrier protein n=1 Tax=Actinacidiphila yeochonensis TaxID=89050 RepID=UPI0005678247|nr:acyl carrier protein [Actinacidiphila yeochonensis]